MVGGHRDGPNCEPGYYPIGVDGSSGVQDCTPDEDAPDSDAEVPDAITVLGGEVTDSAITLVQSTAPTLTAEGRLEWDTDDDLIVIGDGSSQAVFYPGPHPTAASIGADTALWNAAELQGFDISSATPVVNHTYVWSGLAWTLGFVTSGMVADGTLNSADLGDDSVTRSELGAATSSTSFAFLNLPAGVSSATMRRSDASLGVTFVEPPADSGEVRGLSCAISNTVSTGAVTFSLYEMNGITCTTDTPGPSCSITNADVPPGCSDTTEYSWSDGTPLCVVVETDVGYAPAGRNAVCTLYAVHNL